MNKGLFIDRDGTLIVDIPYLFDPDKIELIPGVPQALKTAKALGFLLFLFTNQSGIGRGLYTHKEAQSCNQRLIEMLGLGADVFTEICIAPEHPDDPPLYRKPSPRFILEMAEKYGLDLNKSYMVGDRLSDVQCALNAHTHPIRVETGKSVTPQEQALIESGKLQVFEQFSDFVNHLKNNI